MRANPKPTTSPRGHKTCRKAPFYPAGARNHIEQSSAVHPLHPSAELTMSGMHQETEKMQEASDAVPMVSVGQYVAENDEPLLCCYDIIVDCCSSFRGISRWTDMGHLRRAINASVPWSEAILPSAPGEKKCVRCPVLEGHCITVCVRSKRGYAQHVQMLAKATALYHYVRESIIARVCID